MASVATYYYDLDEESLPLKAIPGAKRQENVLLIEDSEESMWLVQDALQEHGQDRYRLRWAPNLSEGLDCLAQESVDVVLLDLGLPDSSGPTSYAWVREIAPKTLVIVLTADSRQETEVAVTASGADGYLVKNHVSGRELFETIHMALYIRRRRRLSLTPGGKQPLDTKLG